MNDWQRSFLQKLDTAKKQWQHRFEQFVSDYVEPVFHEFDDFSAKNGFHVSSPDCESGVRLYKFALTENGYLLVTFRMQGMEEVEVACDSFVPGVGGVEPSSKHIALCDANELWVQQQFQNGLDRFVTAFAEAGAAAEDPNEVLVRG
ncbi:MAG: hypothetical protein ACYSUI_15460 [Planctomycetota bacterium]